MRDENEKRIVMLFLAGLLAMPLWGCSAGSDDMEDLVKELQLNKDSKDASDYTVEVN